MDLNITLGEMKEAYLGLTGKVNIDCEIIYIEGKGFISYAIQGDRLLIPDLYGNGKFWLDYALTLAKEKGCTKLVGGTRRNPKAYAKMFGTKVVGYVLEREVN